MKKNHTKTITLLRFLTLGTFFHTPFLIAIFLLWQNSYWKLNSKHISVLKQIENENIQTGKLTLELSQHHNHQKILDLQTKYLQDMRYIGYNDIIEESDLELL